MQAEILRLYTWPGVDLGDCTDASLSPSAQRLLLFFPSRHNGRLLNLHHPHGPEEQQSREVGVCSAFAWGCPSDCYSEDGASGHFQELLFTSSSRGLTVYMFNKRLGGEGWLDQLASASCYLEVEHEQDEQGRMRLLLPRHGQCSPVVTLLISYDSSCFHKLAGSNSGQEISRLFSNSANTAVGMLLGDTTVVLLRVSPSHLCRNALITLPGDLKWLDLALVDHTLLCLADDGRIMLWSAVTGSFVRHVQHVAPSRRLVATHSSSLVGVIDTRGQLSLLPLDSSSPEHHLQLETVCHPDSEVLCKNPVPGASASAFPPKRSSSLKQQRASRPVRTLVLLPVHPGTIAITSHSITCLVRLGESKGLSIVRNDLRSSLTSADCDYYDGRTVLQLDEAYALGFSYQGSIYLVSSCSLDVVLPPLGLENASSDQQQQWWLTDVNSKHSQGILAMGAPPLQALQQWQVVVLDRALVYDGKEAAEYLSRQNGWSLCYTRLRNLELLLSYARIDDIEQILDNLVPVQGACYGVPRVIFAAMRLMLSKFGSDNELAQAARLLAVASRFTKKLLKSNGIGFGQQSSGNSLAELARYLEVIRTLQEQLYSRRKRRQPDKGDADAFDFEKRKQPLAATTDEAGSNTSFRPGAEQILTTEAKSLKDPALESPGEMVLRWESENVDVSRIVKDALRAGRVPLAVVQLHQRRRRASMDNSSNEADVFKEVQDAGRVIVYELLSKGKVPVALAALRRLGEDIPSALYDLAFGTVRRSLRANAARELQRHAHIEPENLRLLQSVSRIEECYPSNKFFSSYMERSKASGHPDSNVSLQLCGSSSQGSFTLHCGEVDGIVLGSWKTVPSEVEEEEEETLTELAYWAGAAIWLEAWDEPTIDRIILEQRHAPDLAWESQLEYYLLHHLWPNVSNLNGSIPDGQLERSDLQVHFHHGRSIGVPEIRYLSAGLKGGSSWMRKMVQLKLAAGLMFADLHWRGAEFLSLLAHAQVLFHNSDDSSTWDGIHRTVAAHCVEHNLARLLELYLDYHAESIDVSSMQVSVPDLPNWARWLFLQHADFEYEASFANAQTVHLPSASSLIDLAKPGNVILTMCTLMCAPDLPQHCLYSGGHAKRSWQCSIESLQHGLKQFPTLWDNLKAFSSGKEADAGLLDYSTWRRSLFTSAAGDVSLEETLCGALPSRFLKSLRYSIEGPGHEEAFTDPISFETFVNKKLLGELNSDLRKDERFSIESCLLRGCPLAAFNHLRTLRRPADLVQMNEDEVKLLDMVTPLAIENFKSLAVTSACTTLLELAGISVAALRTDIAALLRIADYYSDSELATELAKRLSEDYYMRASEFVAPALILPHLEKASLGGDVGQSGSGLWLKTGAGDGQQLRALQLAMSERWSLVTRFCRVHQLPLSTVYLSCLARDNDWVGFLAESQVEDCPLDILILVSKHFTDARLQSHIRTVLESLLPAQACGVETCKDVTRVDLFYLLAKCEREKFPGKELLQKAKQHRWPLLAIVASCFGDVTPLSCLSAWLEITAARESPGVRVSEGADQISAGVRAAVDAANTSTRSDSDVQLYVRTKAKRRKLRSSPVDSAEAEAYGRAQSVVKGNVATAGDDFESLAGVVALLCEQQRFLPLLRAFELFLPASPLLHFIRFLRAFSQMRLPEASAHLTDFSAFLREETHSKGGKGTTAWISKAAVAGADAMLSACPSPYEKRCMLQLLATADFGDGGAAALRFKRLYWKIQLAEPALHQNAKSVVQGSNLADEDLLTALEKSGKWEDARSWARQLDLSSQASVRAVDHVTEMQAEAMVTEWKELLWDMPEQRAALWRHCQALFTRHSYPPLKAGSFFMKHAEDVEQNGLPSELHGILLLALQWLSGSITASAPVYPVHLLRELETRVWLLAVESEVLLQASSTSIPVVSIDSSVGVGSPVDRTAAKVAAVDGHLRAYNFMTMDEARQLQNVPGKQLKRRLIKREREQTASRGEITTDKNEEPAAWEDRVGEGEVERAILALVEVGQISAARQLQQKLSPSRVPSELVLAETALSVAMLSTPMVKGAVGSSSVLKTLAGLKLVKDVSSASPLQVMEALTAACREGCGRGYCRRITAVAQVANFLGLTFYEAFQKQATELLQLLSLKGQDALPEAKLLIATHSINPASVARLLAESFLKGLLAAHRGGYTDSSSSKEEGPAPLLWRSSDFVQWGQLCPSEPELGHALMRLVISGHDMPHACEVELLILAHQFYESSACLDGMDVLVALAATRVECYVAEGDFTALARLVTGVSNFQALRFVLDLLIENGQLELLLKKRPAAIDAKESSAWVRGFRMAVLSALKHFNPRDLDAFGMVFSHFSMAHEMANLLESRGRNGLKNWSFRGGDQEQNDETLDIMRLFVEASEVYAGIECGNKTRWCCAQASLLSLQLRMPELAWLDLNKNEAPNETKARVLLVEQRRFQEALVVAEAYGLNQPAEWVPVLWSQVLSSGWVEHFLAEFAASLPLWPSMLLELARIYKSEVSARGENQLDFSKWLLTPRMPPEIAKSFRCILRHVRDFRLRTQLATVASGFPDVLDVCARLLDKVPDTAGPLILKRGHGGTYVPLM